MTPENPTTRTSHPQTIGSPFSLILNPSGVLPAMAGTDCTLSLTLVNEGNATPLVNVFVDETTQPVRSWCRDPEHRLALAQGQSGEVILGFELPIDAIPGVYDYTLVIDAPDHYPEDTPILLSLQLQVLPYVQEARLASDPTFVIQPVTTAQQPARLQPGQPLDLSVFVQNRSDRVDRFRLTCPDLDRDWYQILYPENYSAGGIVTTESSLELNPGDEGAIRLLITPPVGVRARVYTPTVYLNSVNNPDLTLLDVVYFQVMPVYVIMAELVPILNKITHQDGQYTLFLRNDGNTERNLRVELSGNEDEACIYVLRPQMVQLLPGGSAALTLTVYPKKRWQRPFYGKSIEFTLQLEDIEQHPVPSNRFQGAFLWEGRPWWQFLLVFLSVLGLVGVIIFTLWLLLPRPPRAPDILEFYPQSNFYAEENDDVVRLNWQVNEPQNLLSLQLQGLSPDGLVISRPVIYDFSEGLPEALEDYCQLDITLICVNVPTDARKAGDYIFEIIATPIPQQRGGIIRRLISRLWRTPYQANSRQTNTIRMTGIPVPEVVSLEGTQANYAAPVAATTRPATNGNGNNGEAPSPLSFQTPIFSLQPNANGIPTVIAPSSNTPEPETPEPDAEAPPEPDAPFTGILLNWEVKHPRHLAALKLVGRDAEGTVVGPNLIYDFAEGIPAALQDYCVIEARSLVCTAVPTNVQQPGTYTFELTPVASQPDVEPIEPTVSDPIKVLSAPIVISEFQINGADALPKYVMQLQAGMPLLLTVSWKVEGSDDVTVELLPSPGSVATEGAIPYPLSQEPGVEVITLKATNGAGDEVSRTVTIEKFVPSGAENGQPAAPPAAAGEEEAIPALPAEPPSEEAPDLPSPPGSSPPPPPGRNAPPPSELPPTLY